MSFFGLSLLMASATSTSPGAELAYQKWRSQVEAVQSAHIESATQSTHRRIMDLVTIDQVARQMLWIVDSPELTDDEKDIVSEKIWNDISEIDKANFAALQRLIPADGWFRKSRDGAMVAHGAWLILQHAPNRAERMKYLPVLEKLAKIGEVDAHDYATLADRTNLENNQPQVYATQASCRPEKGAALELKSVRDLPSVDQERQKIGYSESLAETKANLKVGRPCR